MSSERTKEADEVFCRDCGEAIKRRAELCPHCGVRNEHSGEPRFASSRSDERGGFSREPDAPRSDTDSDTNTTAALAYALPFVTGIVVYMVADDEFTQFHAAQSIAVFGLFATVNSVLGGTVLAMGGIAVGMLAGILSLAGIGIWLILIATAYQGQTRRIPLAAPLADSLMAWTNEHAPNLSATKRQTDGENRTEADPLATLRERYARGEIDDTEFERRLDQLLDSERAAEDRDRREPEFERSR